MTMSRHIVGWQWLSVCFIAARILTIQSLYQSSFDLSVEGSMAHLDQQHTACCVTVQVEGCSPAYVAMQSFE